MEEEKNIQKMGTNFATGSNGLKCNLRSNIFIILRRFSHVKQSPEYKKALKKWNVLAVWIRFEIWMTFVQKLASSQNQRLGGISYIFDLGR